MGVRVQQVAGFGASTCQEFEIAVHDSESATETRGVEPSNCADDVRFPFPIDEIASGMAPRPPETKVILAFDDQESTVVRRAEHFDFGDERAGRLVST